MLACAMAVFVAFLVSLYRTRDAAKAYPRQQRWMRGSVGAASILYIVFCSTYIPYYLSQHDAISLYGPSMTMRLLLLIPVAAAIVTAAGAALLVVSWVQGRLAVKLKVQYSAGIAAAAFMIWFTQYYNLFGLRG